MPHRIITTGVQGLGPLPCMVRESIGEAELERLLAGLELPLTLLERPSARMPLTDMVTLFDRAAVLLGDPMLGVTVGRSMRPEDYGTWARYALAGSTLRHGVARLCAAMRYYQVADSMRAELHGDLARIAYYQVGIRRDRGRQHADHALLPLLEFVRRFLGAEWRPLWVEVPYPRAAGAKDLADRIGVEVRYDRPGAGFVFDRALLGTPGRGVPLGFAELRQLIRGSTGSELTRALADVVDLRLTSGAVALDGAAARLGLRARTLQRRLQLEGISYRNILDTVRRAHAESALTTSCMPVAEIATSLGYEEPAHFTRAFRRWHGCSPTEWRRTRATAPDEMPFATA